MVISRLHQRNIFSVIIVLTILAFVFLIGGCVKQRTIPDVQNKTETSSPFVPASPPVNESVVNATIEQYECLNDSDCNVSATCINRSCVTLTCTECQYLENHSCVSYECCKNEDCGSGQVCSENKCIVSALSLDIPFETVDKKGGRDGGKYNGPILRESLEAVGYLIILNETAWINVLNGMNVKPEFTDFDNYFLLMVEMDTDYGYGGLVYTTITNVTYSEGTVYIYSETETGAKELHWEAWHIVKVKKEDLPLRSNLTFIFNDAGDFQLGTYGFKRKIGEVKGVNI